MDKMERYDNKYISILCIVLLITLLFTTVLCYAFGDRNDRLGSLQNNYETMSEGQSASSVLMLKDGAVFTDQSFSMNDSNQVGSKIIL
ncbi:MAG: hypothetical protein RSD64_00185 [Christensenellaceae bacterium]